MGPLARDLALPVATQDEAYLPTDATSFYLRGLPVLSAFTGAHPEYHTPRDTPDTLDYEGLDRVASFMTAVSDRLARDESPPAFTPPKKPQPGTPRAGLRAYLGTIPAYGAEEGRGVLLSGVAQGGPADEAGIRGGDRIVALAGRTIENLYDYTFALEAVRIGVTIQIGVLRDGESLTLDITPGSRD